MPTIKTCHIVFVEQVLAVKVPSKNRPAFAIQGAEVFRIINKMMIEMFKNGESVMFYLPDLKTSSKPRDPQLTMSVVCSF